MRSLGFPMVACGVLKMGRDTGILGIMWIQRVHKMILNGKLKTLIYFCIYMCGRDKYVYCVCVCICMFGPVHACTCMCEHACI